MKVAILGCGPAGLFAAHGAAQAGADVAIYSTARKSHMRGAQYLHQPIPGLSGESFQIDYRLDGDVAGYRKKVYGDMSDVQVSPDTLVGTAEAWDIREAYDAAWELYGDSVKDFQFDLSNPLSIKLLNQLVRDNTLVISTIPARLLCWEDDHKFESTRIWSTDFVKRIGVFADEPLLDNVVVCSGYEDDWWYRQSRIQGWENTEYPEGRVPHSGSRMWAVEKPVRTNCDCYPTIVRQGRYGLWTKGVLSHEAYFNTHERVTAHILEGASWI